MIYGGTLTTTSDLHFSDDYISNLRMHLLSFSTSGWWTNYPVLVAKSHALYPMTPALVHYWLLKGDAWVGVTKPGIKLGMVSSNERRRHNVTLSLIGWAQTKNNPCQANVLVSVIFFYFRRIETLLGICCSFLVDRSKLCIRFELRFNISHLW